VSEELLVFDRIYTGEDDKLKWWSWPTPPRTSDWPGPPFQLILFPRINTGKNQQFFTHNSPPVEDGTDIVFRNVGF
jgi:hypothetical protein